MVLDICATQRSGEAGKVAPEDRMEAVETRVLSPCQPQVSNVKAVPAMLAPHLP